MYHLQLKAMRTHPMVIILAIMIMTNASSIFGRSPLQTMIVGNSPGSDQWMSQFKLSPELASNNDDGDLNLIH